MNSSGTDQERLLAEIAAFRRERRIAESTFGKMAVRDAGAVDRLRRGTLSFGLGERMRDFIAAEREAMASRKDREAAE